MGFENKFARFMRNTGPARFFLPVGIILIVVGIVLFAFNAGGDYIETKGKVTAVETITDSENGTQYDISFTYTVDGKTYNNRFTLGKSYSVGDDISVFYNSGDPEKISNSKGMGVIPYILIGAGALALAFGIFKTVKSFQKSKELDQSAGSFPTAAFDGIKTADGVTEYYFRFDGHSLKPGYILEDAERRPLYEGKMLKQALVGTRPYEFHNHVSGSVKEHAVGHVMTQTYNDEFFSAKSWFKFDGTNIWDLLHEKGIRISTSLASKFPYTVYDVAKNGSPFAHIESTSMYVHEDEEAEHKVKIPVGRMYYRVWTSAEDLDLLFLTVFAISEAAEQAVVE